jgi:uncharacterized protein (TIGR04255 family)
VADAWKPIHENHAIDVMACVVTFGQVVPGILLKRVLNVAEEAAFAAGLRSRHSLRETQVTIGPDGAVLPSQGPVQGQFFQSSIEVAEDAPVAVQVAEQLHVAQDKVMYRTWRYVSWAWQFERIQKLMLPLVAIVQDIVPISSQRLEYLDRFRWDGDLSHIDYSAVLKTDSPLIAPHVFSRSDLWHSYTGAFLPNGDDRKKLLQIHIDALDAQASPSAPLPQTRWLHILTAREDRFNVPGVKESEQNAELIKLTFDSMHTELKNVLETMISDAMVERIYLWKS